MADHQDAISEAALSAEEAARIDAYWRAANYLTVGQIYLLDNPLLREPLHGQEIPEVREWRWASD